MERVLVFVPLDPNPPHIHPATLKSILHLEWGGALEIVLGRSDGEGGKYADLADKYDRARILALKGGYDGLLTVEADMLLPSDALLRLAEVDADVAYGLYVSRHPGRRVGEDRWLAFAEVTGAEDGFQAVKLCKSADERRDAWGTVRESRGMGLGCTLIGRGPLYDVEFRCPDTTVSCDWYLSLDCQMSGYSQAHHFGVQCGHIDGEMVLWPDVEQGFVSERTLEKVYA